MAQAVKKIIILVYRLNVYLKNEKRNKSYAFIEFTQSLFEKSCKILRGAESD